MGQGENHKSFFLRRDKSDMYEAVCGHYEKYNDVESRQLIAIDLAIQEAHRMGMDWFAHLGIDDCIYVPKAMENSSRRFFGAMPRATECVRLWNMEVVPEKLECDDWFRECTLFQVSQCHCQGFSPPREYDKILRRREGREFESQSQTEQPAWWNDIMAEIHVKRQPAARKLRLDLPAMPPPNLPNLEKVTLPPGLQQHDIQETFFSFTSYNEGRAIVRMDACLQPPLPFGLHNFLTDSGDMLKQIYQANKADDPIALHYPNTSFSRWRKKYEMLGEVRCTQDSMDHMRFHAAVSEVVLHRERRQQEIFYKTFVLQNEYGELPFLAEYGLVLRLDGVRELLEYFDTHHGEQEQLPGHLEWRDLESGLKFAGSFR